ncbi:MAG: hypothetical protein K9K88_04215 [Desulfobacterales bacterium]|nr:hypothetical protein [Desulfobacterales bacterium]
MKKKAIRFVQNQLNARGLDAGPEDGLLGPRTLSALNRVEGIPEKWPKTRKAVAFILKWGRDRAHFARTEYDAWWRLWEEEGWVSLGRQRNFDWMHVQAAQL